MKSVVLLFFVFITRMLFAQQPDSIKFDRIFGCSCCTDTLHDLQNKNILYVLSNKKTQLTAYRFNKKKWSRSTADLIPGTTDLKISCIEFFKPRKIVLRVHIDQVGSHFDLNPKTGRKMKLKK